jgi:hypothetical protein
VGLIEPNKEGTRRPTEEGCDVQKTANLGTLQAWHNLFEAAVVCFAS